jgi:hypothetical protein
VNATPNEFIPDTNDVLRLGSLKREFKALSGNVMKQNQLPLNNRCQSNDEKGKEGFAANLAPEDVNFLDTQDHHDRCTGHQILYRKECERTSLQTIGHDGVQFFCPTTHQIKCEVSVNNCETDDAQDGSKNSWAIERSRREFPHFAIVYQVQWRFISSQMA